LDTRAQVKTYLEILYRRKWWLVVPLLLGLATGAVIVERLPRVYQAHTTVLVTPQALPEDFVRSTVTTRVEQAMPTLTVQILSRKYLERVVRELEIVEPSATDADIVRACNRVRRKVRITIDRNRASWFKIFADDTEPERAAAIADRLAELFIEQNTLRREAQAASTLGGMERWLDEKAQLLRVKEKAIAEFRRNHPWELPTDLQANLQLQASASQRLTALTNETQGLEIQIELLTAQLGGTTLLALPEQIEDVDPTLARLMKLEEELADLRVRYTDENPAVRRKVAEIQELKRRHPELGGPASGADAVESGESASLRSPLEQELDSLRAESRAHERERRQIEAEIREYKRRIENIPIREAQLAELTRDLDAIKRDYDDLRLKTEAARRAEEMEASRKGEQFEIQDRAQVPIVPYKPDVPRFVLMCAMVGLGVGAGLVSLFEFTDQTIRSEEQFRMQLPTVPLLVVVPNLQHQPKDRP
jgi:polysaccharide chain length determinant protein (PEP-CTERM system associated)